MFKDEQAMPTTNYLLFSNSQFTKEYKLRLHRHIQADFQIQLPNEQEEAQNEEIARRRIVEAVGLVRQKVKNGRLLLQFNIEYGFARNLIGGSIIGLAVSIFDIVYFFSTGNQLIGGISIFLAVVFSFLLAIHKITIRHLGNQYAKRLFQEYLQP